MMAMGPHQRRRFSRICTVPAQPFDCSAARVGYEATETGEKGQSHSLRENVNHGPLSDLREARGKAEGYIRGLVDAGHLSNDRIRDYKILSSIHCRRILLSNS